MVSKTALKRAIKKPAKNRKGKYTNHENGKLPVEVIKPKEAQNIEVNDKELFPATRQIIKIDKMDMPLTTVEEATEMWQQYQKLINALIKQEDVVAIQGTLRIRKSGVNKIARFFGYNCEITRAYKEDCTGPQGGQYFIWRVWAKAIAPNGRFRVAGAACASNERRFAHLHHDVYATAETRAKKRAIEELAGMGEIELIESEASEAPQKNPKPVTPSTRPLKKNETYDSKTNTITRDLGNGIQEVGIDPHSWKPMYRVTRGLPSDPNLPASQKQIDWIKDGLKKAGYDLEDEQTKISFKLGRKPNTRERWLGEFTKGDACDVIAGIQYGELEKLIKVETV